MAFESMWASTRADAWSCCGCFCHESMCTKATDPAIAGKYKICCCKGAVTSGESCTGEKGCINGILKLFCCVNTCGLNHPACGCCGCFCCGKPYGEARHVEDVETEFMQDVFWWYYCVSCGCGCGACNYPCCFNDIKVCCFGEKDSSDNCWTDESGCITADWKLVCWLQLLRCPPTTEIGFSCLGFTCCKTGERTREIKYSSALVAPDQQAS